MSSNLLFFRSPGRISEVSRRNLNSRLSFICLVVLGHLRSGATQWPQTQCVQIHPPPQFSRGCRWPHCLNLTSQLVFLLPPLPPAVHVHSTGRAIVYTCKSAHATTLLDFLPRLPISQCRGLQGCFIGTHSFLWPHLISVFRSSPAHRLVCPLNTPSLLPWAYSFPSLDHSFQKPLQAWLLIIKPQLKHHPLRDVFSDHLM